MYLSKSRIYLRMFIFQNNFILASGQLFFNIWKVSGLSLRKDHRDAGHCVTVSLELGRTECLNTPLSLPTVLCVGYSMKLK